MKKLLIISDCIFDRNIVEELRNKYMIKNVYIIEKPLGRFTGFKIMYRHFNYLILALRGYWYFLKYRPQYVLIWQQYVGFYFSIISLVDITRVLRMTKVKINLFYIIAKRSRFFIWVTEKVYNLSIISKVIYFSYKEFQRSSCRKKKLFYYWHKPLSTVTVNKLKAKESFAEKYVFSGGTSNRDYGYVVELASQLGDAKFKIACLESDIKNITVSKNVEIIHNKYGDDFLSCINNSRFVILPLKDPLVGAGKIVILRALELQKPVLTNIDHRIFNSWLGSKIKGIYLFKNKTELQTLSNQLFFDEDFYRKSVEQVKKTYNSEQRYRKWVEDFAELYID